MSFGGGGRLLGMTAMKHASIVLLAAVAGCAHPKSETTAAQPAPAPAAEPAEPAPAAAAAEPTTSGHVEANGVRYYYEVHGEGEPLLLLHGGLGSIDMFDPVLPSLGDGRQVIAVDLHGHGRTALGDRSISLVDMGADMAVVLEALGHEQVDVLGYSMGGGVAFQLAVQHPERVRRLVMVSAGFSTEGFYPEVVAMQVQVSGKMAEAMKATPMYPTYAAVAPVPEDWPRLLDQMGALMKQPYDWSGEVAKLSMPVMIVFADSDMYRPEHIVKFYQLLGGGLRDAGWQREHMSKNRLAILPNLTHYDIFLSPALIRTARPFLDGEAGAPVWTGMPQAE